MPKRHRIPGVLLALGFLACGPDGNSSAETDGTETSGDFDTDEPSTDGTETGDLTMGDATSGAPLPDSVLECGAPNPCGSVSTYDGNPGQDPPTEYTDSQLCALQKLADGDPMWIAFYSGCEGSCYGDLVLLRADQRVLMQDFQDIWSDGPTVDLGGHVVEVSPFAESDECARKPTTYFTDCLETFDLACTRASNWVEDCAPASPASCE